MTEALYQAIADAEAGDLAEAPERLRAAVAALAALPAEDQELYRFVLTDGVSRLARRGVREGRLREAAAALLADDVLAEGAEALALARAADGDWTPVAALLFRFSDPELAAALAAQARAALCEAHPEIAWLIAGIGLPDAEQEAARADWARAQGRGCDEIEEVAERLGDGLLPAASDPAAPRALVEATHRVLALAGTRAREADALSATAWARGLRSQALVHARLNALLRAGEPLEALGAEACARGLFTSPRPRLFSTTEQRIARDRARDGVALEDDQLSRAPLGHTLLPTFRTRLGDFSAGTAFVLGHAGQTRLVTALHLLGPAGGLPVALPPARLPAQVAQVRIEDSHRRTPLGQARRAAPHPAADADAPGRDLIAFETLDSAAFVHRLAEAAPVDGQRLYLLGRERRSVTWTRWRRPARVIGRDSGLLVLESEGFGLHPGGLSGAPVVDEAGAVQGMLVRWRAGGQLICLDREAIRELAFAG